MANNHYYAPATFNSVCAAPAFICCIQVFGLWRLRSTLRKALSV